MKKNNKGPIKLTESEFKTLVESSVKQILSEISWATTKDASEKSDNRVDMLTDAWYDFENVADNLIQTLHGIDASDYNYIYDKSDPQPLNTQGPRLGKELENLMVKIKKYIDRKQQQSFNLKDGATDKFNTAFNNRDFDQVANDIENVRDAYDDSDERDWKTYREKHLTPSEIEFDNKYN